MDRIIAGDYRVVRPLSEGGMGSVFVVEQVSTGKLRALKLMKPELARDPKFRERFALEAKVGARIESEHVVEVIAAGIDDANGAPWLVMELLEGEDLSTRVTQRSGLPLDEVKLLFRQLGHALERAHAAQIVHRDLKPENLFVARSRREGADLTLKVLDFGIAKLVSEAGALAARSTAALGTPLWMAPEQADSDVAIGPRADIWAVGLIAYFALSGHYYWRAAEKNGTLGALMREVLVEPIDPPTQRWPETAARLPAGFDDWFLRCVARDPNQRFASIREAIPPFLSLADSALADTALMDTALADTALADTALPDALAATAPAALTRSVDTPVAPARRAPRRYWLFAGAAVVIAGLFAAAFYLNPGKRASLQGMMADIETEKEAKRIAAVVQETSWSEETVAGAIPIDKDDPAVGAKKPLVYAALFCDWGESCASLLKDERLRPESPLWPVVRVAQKDAVRRDRPDAILAAQAGHAVYEAVGSDGFVRYRDLVFARLGELTMSNIVGWAKDAGVTDTAELTQRLVGGRWRAKVDQGGDLAARLHLPESRLYGNCEPDAHIGFPGWSKARNDFLALERAGRLKEERYWIRDGYRDVCGNAGLFAPGDPFRRSPFASEASEDAARDVAIHFFAAQTRRRGATMTSLVAERVRVHGAELSRADYVATKASAKEPLRYGLLDIKLATSAGDGSRGSATLVHYRVSASGKPTVATQQLGLVRIAGHWLVDAEEDLPEERIQTCVDRAYDALLTAPAVVALLEADLSAAEREAQCFARIPRPAGCSATTNLCKLELACHGAAVTTTFGTFQLDLETGTASDVSDPKKTTPVPTIGGDDLREWCASAEARAQAGRVFR